MEETQEDFNTTNRKIIDGGLIGLIAGMAVSMAVATGGVWYSIKHNPYLNTPEIKLYHQAEKTLDTLQREREVILSGVESIPYRPAEIKDGLEKVFGISSQQERLQLLDAFIGFVKEDLERMQKTTVISQYEKFNKNQSLIGGGGLMLGLAGLSATMLYAAKTIPD